MDEHALKQLAAQLRKPTGAEGVKMGEWMNKGNVQINRDTLKVLSGTGTDKILEIGMGNGYFVGEMLDGQPSVHYTGCDFSDVMVAEAERLNAKWIENRQARFINADIAALPFDDNTFDKIFTINTIYFWENENEVLAELFRVLKPGGRLILTLRPKRQMVNYPFTKYGFKMFSKEDVALMLTNNGFSVSEIFENTEPDFEVGGQVMKMENLIVAGKK